MRECAEWEEDPQPCEPSRPPWALLVPNGTFVEQNCIFWLMAGDEILSGYYEALNKVKALLVSNAFLPHLLTEALGGVGDAQLGVRTSVCLLWLCCHHAVCL